jgi:hypothetical protein
METKVIRSWLLGIALATPLVLITAWLVRGALAPGAQPASTTAPAEAWRASADLPAERLEERVNGAADTLRAAGCRRLLYWRSEDPGADAEALVFGTADQARAALSNEAGSERTAGPGDEAQASEQAVYYRSGPILVRVFADPGASGAAGLLNVARRLEPELARLHE